MTGQLPHTKVVIVVFAMPGCPACNSYLPKLYRQIEGYQQLGFPFVLYEPGYQLKKGEIPIFVYDTSSKDQTVQDFANQHNVSNLPTTLLLPKYGYPAKYEGELSNDDIYNLLNVAIITNR